jgi:hypothetical protein
MCRNAAPNGRIEPRCSELAGYGHGRPDRLKTAIRPGLNGFPPFCDLIDFPLEPYMRRIARAYFGKSREVAAILPRA